MQAIKSLSLIANRRLLTILLLEFSSGLPIALCGSTLQAWYTVAGIDLVTIGMLSLVGFPYIYKFLWAPFLDRYVPPVMGRRRGWILLMQMALVLVLILMAFMNPGIAPGLLGILALVLALLSATQDIAIDAYRTDLLKSHERGLGATMVTIGYRLAMLVSGALALVLAAKIGWRNTYFCMAGLMALAIFATLWAPELEQVPAPTSLRNAILQPVREFMSRDFALAILLFVVLYKLSDAFALTLGTTFLIRGVGFSLAEIGLIYKVVGIASTMLGAFIGGFLMLRINLYRALMIFGIFQGVSNLAFMILAMVGKNYALMVSAIFIESLCSGLATAAFLAFLMSLCDHRYTAMQYASLSALAAIGRVFVGPLAGIIVKHSGWVTFYWWSFIAACPGLFLLWWLRHHINVYSERVAALAKVSEE